MTLFYNRQKPGWLFGVNQLASNANGKTGSWLNLKKADEEKNKKSKLNFFQVLEPMQGSGATCVPSR